MSGHDQRERVLLITEHHLPFLGHEKQQCVYSIGLFFSVFQDKISLTLSFQSVCVSVLKLH